MVYRKKRAKGFLIVFVIALLVFLLLSAFIEIPLSVKTYSEVFPKEKWLLTRGSGSEVVSCVIDFSKGHTTEYNTLHFERGEFVAANFSSFLSGKKEFAQGDTIVLMRSSDVQDQLVSTGGDLEVALANLKSQGSAQKEPVIREAENRLKYAEERLSEQKILYERAKKLYEKDLSSKQEYELQKWNTDLLEIECRIYSAQLENMRTGVKPEEIKLLEAQVVSIRSKLNFLKERESQLVIKSPINGRIIPSFSPDTLLSLSNFRQVVLHTPVKLSDLREFKEGQKLPMTFQLSGNTYYGQVLAIGKVVKMLSGEQVVFISILLENSPEELLPGMVLESSVKIRNIKLFDHLVRLITY